MNINELLDKYFEGATSCEEERELRRFFKGDDVPEHLQIYRPLFACLAEEVENRTNTKTKRDSETVPARQYTRPHRTFYMLSGIAAGLLLLVGIAQIVSLSQTPENYVIIDGRCYTDEKLVESKALEALQNAGFTDDDLSYLLFQH